MNRKDSPQSVIDTYRRRQQMAPYFLAGLAVLLVVVGIVILVVWFTGPDGAVAPISFTKPTETATQTSTPTATSVPPTATFTSTPTETASPTITETPTPSGPFEYTVQEGDNCWDLAVKNNVDLEVLLALNNWGNTCPIKPGDKILIPLAGAELPTVTAIPENMTGKMDYFVKTGDTLALIASRYNSTVDAIVKENKIKDVNKINVGDKLVIPVNIVTPTPTKPPTATHTPGGPTATTAATETPKP